MGQSRGGGMNQLPTLNPQQITFLQQLLGQSSQNTDQAAQGFKQFLPGGTGGDAIAKAAQQRFQQQTIPSIMNSFGVGAKSSSALNQALAAGAANLNTDIASQLSQLQLGASQGLGNLGANQAQQGLTSPFAYQQKQQPFWQSALLGGIGTAGNIFGGRF